VGVLVFGILKGVLVAAIVSLLVLLRRAASPHVASLGRVPGTDRYSDLERHPDNEHIPGALVVRVESGLFYFNVGHVRDALRRHVAEAGPGLVVVVWDLSSSPAVDLAGARLVGEVRAELAASGIALRLVDARAKVRELLRAALGEDVAGLDRRVSVADALDLTTSRGSP
jgi:MFS superfamily sulfate permease-like transporter